MAGGGMLSTDMEGDSSQPPLRPLNENPSAEVRGPVPSYAGTIFMIGPPFFLVFLGRVRKEEEEEEMKEDELVELQEEGKEGCLFRGTVFTC